VGISSARATTLNSIKSTSFIDAGGGAISEIISGGVTYRVHTFISSQNFIMNKGSGIVEYLIVGGGGSGGWQYAGGGGAGGFLEGMLTLSTPGTYPVVIGAGGVMSSTAPMISGNSSSFNGIVALGGGAGGSYAQGGIHNGVNGGSGGGGAIHDTSPLVSSGGIGTSGQGNNGGTGVHSGASYPGGGGGGAGAAGTNATSGSNGGSGGIGKQSSINGTTTYYAGGGGGSANDTAIGLGGLGGGGNGSKGSGAQTSSTPGSANSGGGGGGGSVFSGRNHSGGSGIVILRYRIS
jgi:hypothetical protein